MGLDVVRMTVYAVLRIRRYDLWLLLAQDRGEPGGRFLQRRLVERPRVLVVSGSDHARIAVAEELDPVCIQDPGGVLELFRAHLAEARAIGFLIHVVDLAHLSARRRHEHDAVPVGARLQHRPACRYGFVVRVRVHQEEGAHDPTNRSASRLIPPWPEPSIATPSPAQAIIDASLRPSPTATDSSCGTPSRAHTNRRADALSLSTLVNSR